MSQQSIGDYHGLGSLGSLNGQGNLAAQQYPGLGGLQMWYPNQKEIEEQTRQAARQIEADRREAKRRAAEALTDTTPQVVGTAPGRPWLSKAGADRVLDAIAEKNRKLAEQLQTNVTERVERGLSPMPPDTFCACGAQLFPKGRTFYTACGECRLKQDLRDGKAPDHVATKPAAPEPDKAHPWDSWSSATWESDP